VVLLGTNAAKTHLTIRAVAQILTWTTAAFCIVRGLPVLLEGWQFLVREAAAMRTRKSSVGAA
jgi:hypothetical protein